MIGSSKKANRLISEKSPYLLQHAFNPVEWYPWSIEAFEKAKQEDKPIFLSIGYSTCHWCHVMEKESFEDDEIAGLMNDIFISIKVDREERPDIDNVYMMACQMLNGSGGWPLSIIMTPDKNPFFAGTYFPKVSQYGRIGLKDLIQNVDSAWKGKRNEIEQSVNRISSFLLNSQSISDKVMIGENHLNSAFQYFSDKYDSVHGGFGSAPKFPSPHNLLFLLRYWKRTGNIEALDMVVSTLTQMRHGGIYDHIGFGFHRYSTDERWLVPHFEKMLYDQALLIIAYTEAYQATKNSLFKKTAEEIIEYILRDMTSPLGGFYSAEDADSDNVEGIFYIWSKADLIECLGDDDADFAMSVFNATDHGNFKDESFGKHAEHNIFFLSKPYHDIANSFGLTYEALIHKLEIIRLKLFSARNKRMHPYKDDKVLVDWNGLMIAALSIAGRAFSNDKYILAAEKSYNFIKNTLIDESGSLLHRYRDGEAGLTANIDDFSFLIWGLIELYQTTFKTDYLYEAIKFSSFTIKHFWDEVNRGFFYTPDYGESLFIKTKEIYDGAIPSGNSVMLMNLVRLYHLTCDSHFYKFAKQLIDSFSEQISKAPFASSFTLCALEYLFGNSVEIVVVNRDYDLESKLIMDEINSRYIPNKGLIFQSETEDAHNLTFDFLKNYYSLNNKPTIYLCRNFSCLAPTNELNSLLQQL